MNAALLLALSLAPSAAPPPSPPAPPCAPVPLAFMAAGGALATAWPEVPGDVQISDLGRFPPAEVVGRRTEWLVAHREWARGQAGLHPHETWRRHYAIRVDEMCEAWSWLGRAQDATEHGGQGCAGDSEWNCLPALRFLREQVGAEAYARGEMPFPSP